MSIKSTQTLTRKEAEKLYFNNFMKIKEEEIKLSVNMVLMMIDDNVLETFLETQAEQLGDKFINYNIIKEEK